MCCFGEYKAEHRVTLAERTKFTIVTNSSTCSSLIRYNIFLTKLRVKRVPNTRTKKQHPKHSDLPEFFNNHFRGLIVGNRAITGDIALTVDTTYSVKRSLLGGIKAEELHPTASLRVLTLAIKTAKASINPAMPVSIDRLYSVRNQLASLFWLES
jgi:hypothetical protein